MFYSGVLIAIRVKKWRRSAIADLFSIVGEDFFKPLTSSYKSVYLQCLRIIYDSYRTEHSYGIDRDILIQKLTYYFDDLGSSEMYFEDETETLDDSRKKAGYFLRKLRDFGWVETEVGMDQKIRIIMPNHAVSVIRNLEAISSGSETEYQSELAAIYSLLTTPDLLLNPYPQILKPVYNRTLDLFSALKQLNTSIKKYIDELTADKEADEIIANYFEYNENIGSKAYHRLLTSENISRFRNMILVKLDELRSDRDIFERLVWGYQKVEEESDYDVASDQVRKMLNDIVDYFGSYDEIVAEIQKKHSRYLESTVRRARFLLMNTNNTEGKISTILRYMADQYGRDEDMHLEEDASDEICGLFNIFTQGFVSEESIKSVPVSRKIDSVDQIFTPQILSDEELQGRIRDVYEKNKNRFSRKNISSYVAGLLEEREVVLASSIDVSSKRDMIRLIFISLYGQTANTDYIVIQTDNVIEKEGFRYHDFEIRRKA